MAKSIFLVSSFLMLISQQIFAAWQDRKAEGWAWYEDRKIPQEKEAVEQSKTPGERIEEEKRALDEKLSEAILNPTEEHVLAYMEAQQKWLEQSAKFAMTWERILVNNPYLDYTVTGRPVSQYGLQWYKEEEAQRREQLITSLTDDFGLFFFYEGSNQVSEIVGNIVHLLSQKYDFEVIGVSVDGATILSFPNSREDNGITEAFGVSMYPAIYLVNPQENVAIPISFGLMALDQIEKNIELQFGDSGE